MLKLNRSLSRTAVVFCTCLFSNMAYGQWDEFFKAFGSSSVGYSELALDVSTLYNPRLPKPLMGFHLKYGMEDEAEIFGLELASIFFLRLGYFFPQGAQSQGYFDATSADTAQFKPIIVPHTFNQNISYLMLEMGSEYYFLFNPKGSVGLYTGWLAAINIQNNEVYYQIAAYDDLHYTLITESDWQAERKEIELGTILGINVGCDVLVGDFGALYFETSFMLNLFSETKKIPQFNLSSPTLMAFSLGYKFEL